MKSGNVRTLRLVFLTLFCTLFSQEKIIASDTLILSKENKGYFDYLIKNQQVETFVDTSGDHFTIGQVAEPAFAKNFVQTVLPSRYDPLKKYTYWIKTTISNHSAKTLKWIFLQGDPSIGHIEFYAPDANKHRYYLVGKGGMASSFQERQYTMVSLAFDLPLDSGETKTFYMKMNSKNTFAFKMLVHESKFSLNYFLSEYYFIGLYYGMLILMAAYNIIIYLSIRDKVYIYYVLYVLATCILNSLNDKTAFQFLWPEAPVINTIVYYFGQPGFILFLTLYSNNFLSVKEKHPGYYRFLNYSAAVLISYQICDALWLNTGMQNYVIMLQFIFIYIIAYRRFMSGYSPARFFLLGFTFVLAGMAIFVMATNDILPVNVYTVYAYNAGVIAETIILSRAIGDRFKFIKESKEEADRKLIAQLKENEELKNKANTELEEKVKERTNYIEMQAAEIRRINQLLKEDNQELANNVSKLSQSRVLQEDISYEEFQQIYPDEEACYKFLETVKWKNDFVCRKCGHTSYNAGPMPYSRKCTRCRTIESVTAHTILHGVKFPVDKALFIILTTTNNMHKYTTEELSEILQLRRATCWTFQHKVKEKIISMNVPKKGKLNWVSLITETPVNSKT